ncbi:MAG: hypothetical protein F9K40_15235 [Kofleriaceae bacterium]|nr:MAG: hypothetical protein F9K40_15235 [Kofleriaceae bacterium]MBZ0231921.1 hypothetical protein [Kofleriaceae bacterium]
MRKIKQKLAFKAETIRVLSKTEMQGAGGGGGFVSYGNCSSVTSPSGGLTCNADCWTYQQTSLCDQEL